MLNSDGGSTDLLRQHVGSILQQLTCYQRELQRCEVERSMSPTMLPYAIETAARADHERVPLLLYCPSEGRWHAGVWWQGAWRLKGDVERVLYPTHWLPASTDVVVARDPVARRASTDVEVARDPVDRRASTDVEVARDPVARRASTDVVVESDPVDRRAGGGGSSGRPPS
jgi:hypothetical protein